MTTVIQQLYVGSPTLENYTCRLVITHHVIHISTATFDHFVLTIFQVDVITNRIANWRVGVQQKTNEMQLTSVRNRK